MDEERELENSLPSPVILLSTEQLSMALSSFAPGSILEVVRIRYRNQREIRRSEQISVEALTAEVLQAKEEGHHFGGDFEVDIPSLGKTLVGHHDGVYWFEAKAQHSI